LPLAQISTGDLNVGVLGQLPAAHLALGDQFEAGPMQIVGFQATLRCRGLVEEGLEDAPRDPDDALVFADADAELVGKPFGIPSGIRRKMLTVVSP
jgi:hypothetical protein